MRKRIEERPSFFPWSVKEPLFIETGGVCAHCGAPLDRYTNLTVDHVIPLGRGGTNAPENLTVLCDVCNTEKSDMIVRPMEYYGHIPMGRRKKLHEMLDRYIKETDYLAPDCLLPIDMFSVQVPQVIVKNCRASYKVMKVPVIVKGTRMTRDDGFAWLKDYAKSLQYREQKGVMSDPSQFEAPCYLMKKGDIELAMVNPWMIHEWDEGMKGYRNEILVDVFFSPSLPDKDYLPEMLAWMVSGTESRICTGISEGMEGACAVLFRTRCFYSDRFCEPAFDILSKGRSDARVEFDTGYSLPARIRELTMFQILGSPKACAALSRKLDEQHAGTMSVEEAAKENSELNRRFEA